MITVGCFTCLGIPKNSILKYETAVKKDKDFVIAHGTRQIGRKTNKSIESIDTSKPRYACLVSHQTKFDNAKWPLKKGECYVIKRGYGTGYQSNC